VRAYQRSCGHRSLYSLLISAVIIHMAAFLRKLSLCQYPHLVPLRAVKNSVSYHQQRRALSGERRRAMKTGRDIQAASDDWMLMACWCGRGGGVSQLTSERRAPSMAQRSAAASAATPGTSKDRYISYRLCYRWQRELSSSILFLSFEALMRRYATVAHIAYSISSSLRCWRLLPDGRNTDGGGWRLTCCPSLYGAACLHRRS